MSYRKRPIKHVLQWLIEGSRGGVNRARIISALREEPKNANQLGHILGVDYRTIRHHLEVLDENGLITSMGDKYGKVYFLSTELEENLVVFDEIWNRLRKKLNNEETGVDAE
jgi:DNA-binding transcriptional ArsR family regulator